MGWAFKTSNRNNSKIIVGQSISVILMFSTTTLDYIFIPISASGSPFWLDCHHTRPTPASCVYRGTPALVSLAPLRVTTAKTRSARLKTTISFDHIIFSSLEVFSIILENTFIKTSY
jgi:hypothetical protein